MGTVTMAFSGESENLHILTGTVPMNTVLPQTALLSDILSTDSYGYLSQSGTVMSLFEVELNNLYLAGKALLWSGTCWLPLETSC